ncbi:MAG: hypothetical protein WCI57_04930 [Candidatus Berkelbacteria bacterium]
MKIKAENAQRFINHCTILAKLAGQEDWYDGMKIYGFLNRLERKENRRMISECNTVEDNEARTKKVKQIISKILPNLEGFKFNGDPRGYTLKISEEEAKKLGIYTDWGGYGILAPEF